jgi:tRNA nucleotidyltransferase/poly(A) polymerase
MSDYIYILESRLSPEQNQAVAAVQAAAARASVNLFLTGGAMRDMLAGGRIRDLDFVVEGPAQKLAKFVCESSGAKLVSSDELRKSAELVFPSGVTAQIAMSRQERYARSGAKPQISPATIQDDLRGRDFTCNAIALSLNRASRGLLLDPMNGLADIERRELRAVTPYGFYDDPSRLLRLIRFQVRLEFAVEERTQMQVANAREAGVEKSISPRTAGEELKRIAVEDKPAEIIRGLDAVGLLTIFSPALTGASVNLAGLARLEKAERMAPDDLRWRAARFGPFMYALAEKLSIREKQSLVRSTELSKPQVDAWQKLPARAKKLESALRSARIKKPSHVYHLVAPAAPDEVLFLLAHSQLKPVQERLRNYFTKYEPAIQEITPEEWATVEGKPGTPKHAKAVQGFITQRLDRRPRKPQAPPPEPVAIPAETGFRKAR